MSSLSVAYLRYIPSKTAAALLVDGISDAFGFACGRSGVEHTSTSYGHAVHQVISPFSIFFSSVPSVSSVTRFDTALEGEDVPDVGKVRKKQWGWCS